MRQAKFSLTDEQAEFLGRFAKLGYSDRSSMVREAIDRLRQDLAEKQLRDSADLYAEVYSEDDDLKRLTEAGLQGWPV